MVVAPYNRQVRLLESTLDSDPHTRGVAVGTVDKFQGREAAVVFFSMTASDTTDIPRGSAFLFSQNRLNVAISEDRGVKRRGGFDSHPLSPITCHVILSDRRERIAFVGP